MADESPINTFDLSVKLPITDASPPDLFFKINFNCNGIITISDAFASAADALEWCQDELAAFGTWTVSDNTLYLSESLCGVGSLSVTVTSQSQGDEVIMELDDSSPQVISDMLGIGLVDVSRNHQRVGDTVWLTLMNAIDFKYADAHPNPISDWYHVKPLGGGDGYNILLSEATALGLTLAEVEGGVGNETYGYDFFTDEYSVFLPTIGIHQSILSVNINTLLIQVKGTDPVDVASIDFTDSFAEWEFYIDTLAASGVAIRSIQLATELGLSTWSDIIHSADDVKNVCEIIIDYFRTNHPSYTIYSDAYQADDTSGHLNNYNATLATLDTDGARQYFQFNELSYEESRERIYELSSVLTKFRQQFPNKKLRFQQAIIKPGNPLQLKVGEGLIYAEWWMNVIKQSILQPNLITDVTLFNVSRLISGQNEVAAAYYFTLLARGMFSNDGMIEVTLDNPNLVTLGTKTGSSVTIYILNPTSDFHEIDAVELNGTAKNVTVESYYNDPEADEPNHHIDAGSYVLLYPHSLTKIVTT